MNKNFAYFNNNILKKKNILDLLLDGLSLGRR